MAEYFVVANLDKFQVIEPADVDGGIKWRPLLSGPVPILLAAMLAHEWAGDRVQVVGDESNPELYDQAKAWENVTEEMVERYQAEISMERRSAQLTLPR